MSPQNNGACRWRTGRPGLGENGMTTNGKAIVFDLDGTLIDSAPDIRMIANQVLAREGVAPLTLPQTRSFIGNGAAIFITRMMAARDLPQADHPRLLASFIDRYETAFTLTTVYDGVAEALSALTQAGFALGICTNKPLIPARAVLAHVGLQHHFAVVIGGDSLPSHKPDPAPLLRAFADLGTTGGLFVGDSEVDHETAQRAGLPFALFTEGYRKTPPEAFVQTTPFSAFRDLPALVARHHAHASA